MTQFLDVAGGRLAYGDAGTGPVVICVPGMGVLREDYRLLTPRLLAAGYRVVTLDPRGQGESSARWPAYSVAEGGADILALARALDAGPVTIIGTSMAAGSAVWAAAEAPELVAGVALISPFARATPLGWKGALMNLVYQPLFSGPWGASVWVGYLRTLYPSAPPADLDAYLKRVQANLREPGRMAALRAMLAASKDASGRRLGRVTAPAVVIMGAKDPDFPDPEAEARTIAASLGRPAPYHMIADAGHYPYAEAPERTQPLLLAFLNDVRQEATHGA